MKDELNGLVVSHKPVTEQSLKRLLLIFDKVYIIKPEENRFLIPKDISEVKIKIGTQNIDFRMPEYGVLYNGLNYQNQENLTLEKFDFAINKGAVRILDLNLKKFYNKNWLPLRVSHEFDSANAELMNTYLPLISHETDIVSEDGVLRGSGMSYSGIQILPDTPPQIKFFSDEENKIYHYDHQVLSASGKVSRALAASTEFDLIPIFLNESIANAFSTKIDFAKENNEDKLRKQFYKSHNVQLDKVQFLLHRISEILLPDEIMDNISIRELLIARDNSYNECIKLRRKLIRSVHFIATENHGTDFSNEVNKYIKNEIEPMISAYQNAFITNLSRFLKHSIPVASAVAGAVLGYNQNLSLQGTVYLTGISTAAGSVVSDLSNYIINRPSKKFKNGFTYFLNLRE